MRPLRISCPPLREVLARELLLGEADVASIVAAALARFSGERVLSIRAHPRDLDALGGIELDRIADDTLPPGDIRLDLRSGTIDLTLAARLEAVLAAGPS
jgi:flagellar biosynthesis/type III secretory pathway protein FliH